jgi:hypothetical protein
VIIMRRKLIGAAVAAFCLMLWLDAAHAAAGTVVAVSGSCTAGGRPLKLGDSVQVSDMLDVPTGAKLKLRMSDGSIISLAPGTRVAVAAYEVDGAGRRRSAQLALAQGLIRAIVAPVERPATFEVSTAVGAASVRGTDWFIDVQAGSTQVGVLTGSVDLASAATGRTVTIPAHWGTRLEAGRDPVQPRVWSQAEFDALIRRTE